MYYTVDATLRVSSLIFQIDQRTFAERKDKASL